MDNLIGQNIGGYVIRETLGRGGMATVYLANQPQLDRYIALKLLPRELMHDQKFLLRFQREAKVVAQLTHPHILPVHNFGQDQGWIYIAMTYLAGRSLKDYINDTGAIPLTEVVRIVEQIADALDYAHSQGVIHRDLKPGNILLDEQKNAYLTDFGIVKLIGESQALTGSGIVGTPAYMAPEMTTSNGVSPLVDIYALGATIYEMLTGLPPYRGATIVEVLMSHVTEPVPEILKVRPDLPAAFDDVIRRAMAKTPETRYPKALPLAADLRSAASEVIEDTSNVESVLDMVEDQQYSTIAITIPFDTLPIDKLSAPTKTVHTRNKLLRIVMGVIVASLLVGGSMLLGVPLSKNPDIQPTATAESIPLPSCGSQSEGQRACETRVDEKGVPQVRIPAGSFVMGTDDERFLSEHPAHVVALTYDYWIDLYEVSNDQYQKCVEAGTCEPPGGVPYGETYTDPTVANYPVGFANWFDAVAFCSWRGGRLPTEAEWEYAARGIDQRIFPWGDDFDCSLTNTAAEDSPGSCDGYEKLAPVNSYPQGVSPFGLYNMAGNVEEWVADWFDAGYYENAPSEDPQGPDGGLWRSLRGGGSESNELSTTAFSRSFGDEKQRQAGLRCVHDVNH